ncbi:hypothetical protein C2S52_021955 [Perilla frutescens var. hirtella]|nr:hypothetical protein C2S52_021955 [Perilla frutescens var. hirtella]
MQVRTMNSEFNYHSRCVKLKITHLAFVDDLMLFCRGDVPSAQILMDVLAEFEVTSALHINKNKSELFTSRIRGTELNDICEIVGFPMGKWPVKYLGIPLDSKRLDVVEYRPLIDKVAEYVNAWAAKTLSYAGGMVLVQSVLQGVACYWLQIFPLPEACTSQITRLCRVFLWGSKKAPVAWKTLYLPQEDGGLGFKDLRTWNRALLSKVLWNIQSRAETLWIKWVHEEYLKGRDLWSWVPKTTNSQIFKNLAQIRDLLTQSHGNDIEKTKTALGKCFLLDKGTTSVYEWLRNKG